ncbi:MAG: type II CAAX prenyl endopeptidase Rce1 family protein [Candidatus Caccovivens sp.]
MNATQEIKKVFDKRNFYTVRDVGKIYLYALLLPFVTSLIFCYISMAILRGSGIEFAEGTNIVEAMFNSYLWFSIPCVLISQMMFLCIYFGYNGVNRISQKSCNLSFKKANIWTALLCMFVGMVCVLGFMLLIEGSIGSLGRNLGLFKPESSMSLPINTVGWLFVHIFISAILPGICEELLFRGMIFGGLREKFSPVASVLLSALLFALMHQSVEQFVYPFILGCVLAVVYEKTNNILYSMLIHIFNNLTTVFVSFLQAIGAITLPFASMNWWLVLISIVVALATCAILFVIYKFYLSKQQKLEVEKTGEADLGSTIGIGKFPLTLIFGILIAVVIIVINAVG